MSWTGAAEVATVMTPIVALAGHMARKTFQAANTHLRAEIHQETSGQTDELTARITEVDTRISLTVAVAVAAAAGVLAALAVPILRRAGLAVQHLP